MTNYSDSNLLKSGISKLESSPDLPSNHYNRLLGKMEELINHGRDNFETPENYEDSKEE